MKGSQDENSSDEEVTFIIKNLDDDSTILFNSKNTDI